MNFTEDELTRLLKIYQEHLQGASKERLFELAMLSQLSYFREMELSQYELFLSILDIEITPEFAAPMKRFQEQKKKELEYRIDFIKSL